MEYEEKLEIGLYPRPKELGFTPSKDKYKDKEDELVELLESLRLPILICLKNDWDKDFYMACVEGMWEECPFREKKNEN